MLDVTIFNTTEIVFKGQARSVILPGENGVFEVLPFHKRVVSRLITGDVEVDGQIFSIFRGIVGVNENRIFVVVEDGPLSQEPSNQDGHS